MADIFFSYKREEHQKVEPIVHQLLNQGWSVFWDPDIEPGTPSWDALLERELIAAKSIVVAWSTLSANSHWVRTEAHYGRTQENLVPLTLDGVIPVTFQLTQTLDLSDWKGEVPDQRIDSLVEGVRKLAGNPPIDTKIIAKTDKSETPEPTHSALSEEEEFEALMAGPDLDKAESFLRRFGGSTHGFIIKALIKKLEKEEAQAREEQEYQARLAEAQRIWAVLENLEDEEARSEFFARYCDAAMEASGCINVQVGAGGAKDVARFFKPGNGKKEWFKDHEHGPEMVVIPAGKFIMGSPSNEDGRSNNEGPQHEVTISNPFAVGRYAVTFDEWDAAQNYKDWQEVTGIEPKWPDDKGWGRGKRPVINILWEDAQAYIKWLSAQTGKAYRLLSEAEWEYCCRAGTTTPFNWGLSISTDQANYNGNYTYGDGVKGEYRRQTVPVDHFSSNPWGLYQMHGNVWEWVADHWHDNYEGAPIDGSVWQGGDASYRVLRGGSWFNYPQFLRSANRYRIQPDLRVNSIGFRLARTLNP